MIHAERKIGQKSSGLLFYLDLSIINHIFFFGNLLRSRVDRDWIYNDNKSPHKTKSYTSTSVRKRKQTNKKETFQYRYEMIYE